MNNTELLSVLRNHARMYPKMQPTDAVKLIFQNEFGGGHLIPDLSIARRYLNEELACLKERNISSELLVIDIGNGIVRLDLYAVQSGLIEAQQLALLFASSASVVSGRKDSFVKKLEVLQALTNEGVFSFEKEELLTYLEQYRGIGMPPVSHSEEYRRLYKPAYRIVSKKLLAEGGFSL